jgi:D-amino peptidase
MKIFIVTDMEGTAGVLDFQFCWNWEGIPSRLEEGRSLVTDEINAACQGFFDAGATEIDILDGHGQGGIHQASLDPRTKLVVYNPGKYPFGVDETYDAMAWVGQHAKSSTPFSHIPHTGWFNVINYTINGVSVGEFGQMAMVGASMGVQPIFGSGEEAFAKEAVELVPGFEAVAVKRGLTPGSGEELNFEEYKNGYLSAFHLHPDTACKLIKEGAYRAAQRFIEDRDSFAMPTVNPPYNIWMKCREEGPKAPCEQIKSHPSNLIEAMNAKWKTI